MIEQTPNERRAIVLVVEDEPMICDIATEALLEQGFEVQAVSNASEALRYLSSDSPIDVLFTDVNLGSGMDGGALARRARELHPDLPVMYASGRHSTTGNLDPVERSMFITKPHNPFDIGRLLDYLVWAKSRLIPESLNGVDAR